MQRRKKRWLRRFALLTGVLLLPVLVLAVFARPSADDFIYAARHPCRGAAVRS